MAAVLVAAWRCRVAAWRRREAVLFGACERILVNRGVCRRDRRDGGDAMLRQTARRAAIAAKKEGQSPDRIGHKEEIGV